MGSRRFGMMTRAFAPLIGAGIAAGFVPMIGSVVFPLTFKGQIPPLTSNESLFVGVSGALFFGFSLAWLLRSRPQSIL
jgi:hypothetical protein